MKDDFYNTASEGLIFDVEYDVYNPTQSYFGTQRKKYYFAISSYLTKPHFLNALVFSYQLQHLIPRDTRIYDY